MIVDNSTELIFERDVSNLAMDYFLYSVKTNFENDPDLDYQILRYKYTTPSYCKSLIYHTDLTKRLIESNDNLISVLSKERINLQSYQDCSYFYEHLFEVFSKIFKKNKMKCLGINHSKKQYSTIVIVIDRKNELYLFDKDDKNLKKLEGYK